MPARLCGWGCARSTVWPEEEVKKIMAARPFRDVHDLWLRAGVKLATLEKLAAADAFRSVQAELGFAKTGLDRRQALWEVKALGSAVPLPLFTWSETREAGLEPAVALPEMALSEHVVNDYQTLRLSLKAHPMSFLRERFQARRVRACHELRALKDGAYVSVAGVILVRQRPGSAKGVVFMTIEDETGIANAVVWPKTLERFRKVVMGARLIVIHGRIQRHEDIIHVVSARLEDRSDWLRLLSEEADRMKAPLANADEVLRPDPGSARSPTHPRLGRAHPAPKRGLSPSRGIFIEALRRASCPPRRPRPGTPRTGAPGAIRCCGRYGRCRSLPRSRRRRDRRGCPWSRSRP